MLKIKIKIKPIGSIMNLKCFLYSLKLYMKGLPSKLKIYVQSINVRSFKNIQEFINVGMNSSSLSISFYSSGAYFFEKSIIKYVAPKNITT